MRYSLLIAIIICILVGALGGAASAMVINAPLGAGILLGMLYGLVFALFGASRAVSPGAGLLWGLGYSFVLWLAIPEGIVPVVRAENSILAMKSPFSDDESPISSSN